MTYKLKEHVTDEMLIAVGFRQSNWDKNEMLRKVNDNTVILLTKEDKIIHGKMFVFVSLDVRSIIVDPYIQDLIELGYVEVVE